MENENIIEALAPLLVYLGAIVFFVLDYLQARDKKQIRYIIDNNKGSVLSVITSMCLVVCSLSFLVFLLVKTGDFLSYNQKIITYYCCIFIAGMLIGKLLLRRSIDVGKGRAFALLGLLPVISLWVIFMPPAKSHLRPKYEPESPFLRFVIGCLVFAICVYFLVYFEQRTKTLATLEEKGDIAELIRKDVQPFIDKLPIMIDDITVLNDLKVYDELEQVAYYYIIEGDNGLFTLDTRQTNIIKRNVKAQLCGEPLLKVYKWQLFYEYRRNNGALIGSFIFTYDDCFVHL